MRCARCGMPLSPISSHQNCPRCGTALARGTEGRASSSASAPQNTPPFQQGGGPASIQVGLEQNQQQWRQHTPTPPPWNMSGMSFAQQAFPPMGQDLPEQIPFPEMAPPFAYTPPDTTMPRPQQEQNQGWPSATPVTPAAPMQGSGWPLPPPPSHFAPTTPMQIGDRPIIRPPSSASRQGQGKRTGNVGFTIASLCVIIGGLLLVFVYFMAQGLPSISPNTLPQSSVQATTTVKITPTVSPVTTTASPTPATSPTPTYPGQQYIDNAQMASQVNTKTATPLTLTTTFKVSQQMFVTFALHPSGHVGAVCLLWYANSQPFSHYEFPVSGVTTPAYSYTFARSAGSGYVEIYWASTTACSDKVLAQHLDFTVNA